MRADIRLLGTILGDTVREQNGDEVFDLVERARVESFRVRRSEIDRAEMSRMFDGIDIHLAIPIIRAFSHFALLANVAEDIHRERRRGIHVDAGEPPQDSSLAATYAKLDLAELDSATVGRGPEGCAGFPGDHRPSHRDPAAHRLRHPAPDHRVDATARGGAHRDRRRPQHRTGVAPPGPHAVADRADPAVPAADHRRDRRRPALLPGRVVRGDPAGQRRGSRRAACPLARRRAAVRAHSAARLVDRRRPRRKPERDRRRGPAGHRQRRVHRAGALPGRAHRSRAGAVDVGAADHRHPRAGRAGRRLPGAGPRRRAVPAGVAGDPRPAHRDRRRDPGSATAAPA